MKCNRYTLALALFAAPLFGQTVAAPMPVPNMQFLDCRNGTCRPLVGGMLFSYAAGTATPLNTYTDSSAGTPNSNPVILDSSGYNAAGSGNSGIWIANACYKFELQDVDGVTIWTQDNVCNQEALMLAALAATGGAALIGFEPTGGTVPLTVASALNTFLIDTGYASFAAGCSAATGATKTLLITQLRTVPTGTYACNLWFLAVGKLKVNTNGTAALTGSITCPAFQQCFDTSTNTNAKVTFSKSPPDASAVWWGADPTGTNDSAAAINACIIATGLCNIPEGTYKTLSLVSTNKHYNTLRCASRLTTITYAGGAIFAPFKWGGTLSNQNHNTVENCNFIGNAAITGAVVYNTQANYNTYRNVLIQGGNVTGFWSDASIQATLESMQVGAGASTTPIVGIKLRGSNQPTITNPVIESMAAATGIDIDTTTGVTLISQGTLEGLAIGINVGFTAGQTGGQTIIQGTDFEAISGYMIVTGGAQTSMFGPNVVASTGGIHVLSTATRFLMDGANTNSIVVDAGATNTAVINSTFDSGANPAITDAGTDSNFQGNNFASGAPVRLEDYFEHNLISSFQGQPFGCQNCILGVTTGQALKGTFTFFRATHTISVYDHMVVQVQLIGALAASSASFEFTGAVDSGGVPMGVKNIYYRTSGTTPIAMATGEVVRLQYSRTGDCWIQL